MAEKYVKLNDIIDTLEHEWGYEGMREDLEKLPTADVAEVRHGYWIKGKRIGINVPQYTCSKCGKWEDAEFPYCNCGAKMDGTPKERGGEK